MKDVTFVILDKFADWEYSYLAAALNGAEVDLGYRVKFASDDREIKISLGNLKVIPDMTLDEVTDESEGLILIGGASWRKLSEEADRKIVSLVKKFKNDGKVVGAICDAVYYLGVRGLLNDFRHTANDGEELKGNGDYSNYDGYVETDGTEAVVDGKMVTASGTAALSFAVGVLKALGDVPEKMITFFHEMHTIGFAKALENFEKK